VAPTPSIPRAMPSANRPITTARLRLRLV
jgi:hypothetical protein